MIRLEVRRPGELDYGAVLELQHHAFRDVMTPEQIERNLNRAYYEWTHNPPAGEARIAVAHDGDQLVAMNSMFPLVLDTPDGKVRGWQSCQTATHFSARGQGLFMRCLNALKEEIRPDEVFFGFPNHNSMRGFLKLGWKTLSQLRTWVRPLPGFAYGAGPLEPVETFESEHCDFLHESTQEFVEIQRSPSYLNWRYGQHPNHRYQRFVFREGERVSGLLVLHPTQLFGMRSLLVMECRGRTRAVENHLARCAATRAWREGAWPTVMVRSDTGAGRLLPAGFLPVPQRWVPRRLVLMGDGVGARGEAAVHRPWFSELGDWDAF